MKKLALSLLVIGASFAYVWDQRLKEPPLSQLDGDLLGDKPSPDLLLAPADLTPTPALFVEPRSDPTRTFDGVSPRVINAAALVAANAGYVDGTYTGPAVNAYYGLVQVQASVQGGRIAKLKILQYPSDRQTSVAINRQALPMLRDEVVAAQSARVDIISGATLTSQAFIRSLDAALKQAH